LLPTLVVSYNVCGEFYFPWHSHALNEFVNFDVPFGGLATLLRVDALPGCTAYPSSTKIIPTAPNTLSSGTLRGGTFGNLNADDSLYYAVNSTTAASPPAPNTFKTDWYGSVSGISPGSSNLKVSYKGNCTPTGTTPGACTQNIYIYNWRTKLWVLLDGPRSVGAADTAVTDVAVPASPSAGRWTDWVSTGSNAGLVQVRIYDTRAGTFYAGGNFMKLVYDAP
jgi:hypothetical protein